MKNSESLQKKIKNTDYAKKILFSLLPGTLLLACLLSLTPNRAVAQEIQTLFSGDISHGGFGGPVVRIGTLDGSGAVWVGGRGGWIINMSNRHSISIGGGGYGLATEHRLPNPLDPSRDELAAIGYGGFELEYTNQTYRLVHLTASTLIGAGGFTIRDREMNISDENPNAFFVMEPGLHAELNLTSFFRVAAGASYRFTSGVNKGGFRDSDISGLNAVITLKFGSF